MNNIQGHMRQQYAIALILLDRTISSIYDKLIDVGQMNNTYIIFTSDNGGCAQTGGQNGPLRGTKGSLFEGRYSL